VVVYIECRYRMLVGRVYTYLAGKRYIGVLDREERSIVKEIS
jgi:hypothetical protein